MTDIGPLTIDGCTASRVVHLGGSCGPHEGHGHNYDHVTYCCGGTVQITVLNPDGTEGESKELIPGASFAVRAGVRHRIEPVGGDAMYVCVFSHRDFSGQVAQTYGPGCTRKAYL